MSVTIPFAPQAARASDAPRGGVIIPLRFGTGTFGTATGAAGLQEREQAVLRAVAAAVALSHTADSLTLAREAQADDDDLGARFAAVVAVEGDLRVVLDEVVRIQGDRSTAPSASEEERVVAQAVGADPVLVAAAHAKVAGNDKTGFAARQWVAVVDAPLLERAARAAARRELVSRPSAATTDIKQLEAKIDNGFKEIKDQITALDFRVAKLEGKLKER
jgi:hypothetical protein